MSRRDALLVPELSRIPEGLRAPVEGVSFAAYLFVEAARLDDLNIDDVLVWLDVRKSAFALAEEPWSDRVDDELAREEGARFDEVYEDLLGRALSLWARAVDPLDREIEAFITFQRHALEAENPAEMARLAGLTRGDELRLARSWQSRIAAPEIAERAQAAWSGPLLPLPSIILSPFVFPPLVKGNR